MRLQSRAVVALIAITVLAAVSPSLVAADGYQISSDDAESMPERTVEFQDGTFTIDSLITAAPGDSVDVDVEAPDEVYRVYVYNTDQQVVDQKRGNGSGSFSFDLSGYEPGSYPITVYHDGNYEAVQPLVVEGYDVSIDAPERIQQGESAEIQIEVDQTAASSSPAHVRAILANDDEEVMIDASESDGSYVATVDGDELDVGSYTVYGAAQGAETVMDRNELLGVSSRTELAVEEASSTATATATPNATATTTPNATVTTTPTATPTPEGDNGGSVGGGGGGGGGASDATQSPTPTANGTSAPGNESTVTGTASATPVSTTSSVDPATATATPTATAQPTATSTPTDAMTSTPTQTETDGSIEPVSPNTAAGTANEAQTETADSGPGFTLVGTALAVLVGAALLLRRE